MYDAIGVLSVSVDADAFAVTADPNTTLDGVTVTLATGGASGGTGVTVTGAVADDAKLAVSLTVTVTVYGPTLEYV